MTDKSRKAVPREPDKAMVIAMLRELTKVGGWVNNDSLAAVWRAAFDVAQSQSIPQEATDAMYRAGMKEIAAAVDSDAMPSPFVVWKAMFDAAPVLATAPAMIAQTCLCPDPHCALHGAPVKTTLTTTAPTEPPKDGEVAALIQQLRLRTKLMVCKRNDGCWVCDDNKLYLEAADALARLSAPVPDKEK